MNEHALTQFEQSLTSALLPGPMSPEFVETLRGQLAAAARRQPAISRPRPARLAWAATAIAAVLLTALFAIGPQRVWAQVLEWMSYIPGVGYVDSSVGLRVLAEPVSQTSEGITFTVKDGVVDADHTWITLYIEGIERAQFPTDEMDPGCTELPQLALPNGTVLSVQSGSGGTGLTWMEYRFGFPALPVENNVAMLQTPCLMGLNESAPQDWMLPLAFIPAPEGYEALPVATIAAVPTDEAPTTIDNIALRVNNYVELETGYLIQGELDWSESPYETTMFSEFELQVTDAKGNTVVVEPIYNDITLQNNDPEIYRWALQTNTKDLASPLSISLERLAVESADLKDVPAFSIDFGEGTTAGQTWELNERVALGDGGVLITTAVFQSGRDGNNFLTVHMLPEEEIMSLGLTDIDNRSQTGFGGGGGGGGSDGRELEQSIGYDYVPTGVHDFVIESVYVYVDGPWTTSVELPVGETSGLATSANACLTAESWQALLAQPTQSNIFDASQRVLVEGGVQDGALFPSLFASRIDGAERVDVGPAGWGSMSQDGNWAAFVNGMGLHKVDLRSGQVFSLSMDGSEYSPVWSPDGTRIAFLSGGSGVWLINADGSGKLQVPGSTADMIGIAGWTPDGSSIVVVSITADGSLVQKLDLLNGRVSNLFVIENSKGGFATLSPDGERIVFSGELFGALGYGLYASNIDGSDKVLIAEPSDTVAFTAGAWSPDSKWVAVWPFIGQDGDGQPIAVNIETCEATLLPVNGKVIGWTR